MQETVGNVTVTAELHDTASETVTSRADVRRRVEGLGEEMKEHLYALFLNASNEELAKKLIGLGTAAETNLDIADIARTAVLTNARAVILVHNHPSGDPSPSDGDVTGTRSVKEALDLFEINLLDHVIVAREDTHSMRHSHPELFHH
jgi:DNA repair protein RadC